MTMLRISCLAVLIALSVCLACFAAPPPRVADAELLKNRGFEGGLKKQPGLDAMLPEYWFRDWSRKNKVELVEDETLARSGKKCVRATTSLTNEERIPVKAGEKLRCRVWMKSGGGVAHLRVIFLPYQVTGPRHRKSLRAIGFSKPPVALTNEWRVYEGVCTVPADGKTDVMGIMFSTSGTVMIDDASLRRWDGRPLAERITSAQMFKDKPKYEKTLAAMPELKKRFEGKLKATYARAEQIKKESAQPDLPLGEDYALEEAFLALQTDYVKLRDDIELELE